jgi:SAM-dependent methyltransferase
MAYIAPGQTAAVFDVIADLYDRYAAATAPAYLDHLRQALPGGHRAVDLGCGSGRFAGLLAARYAEVLAVDASSRLIDLADVNCHHPNVDYRIRDLFEVTADEDGRFDLVLAVDTLGWLGAHAHDHDLAQVLPHVKALVAPGGLAVVVDTVDPGGWRSLDWQIAEAFRDAEDSYRHHARTPEAAADVLRFRLHPAWLDHALASAPLDRGGFRRVYARHFPGADLADLSPSLAAMRWQAPAQPG